MMFMDAEKFLFLMHKFANVKTPVWLSFPAPQTHKHTATSHSTSGLQVHLTKHGGTIARRMLTFIHNSFPCLPPSPNPVCGCDPGAMCGLA